MGEENNAIETGFPEISFTEFAATSYETWKEEAIAALKGADFDKSMYTKTYEGITLQPIYLPKDTEKLTHPKTYPAQASNLRGTIAAGYINKPWKIAQRCDGKTAAEVNAMVKRELLKGSDAISFVLDSATRKGRDAKDAGDGDFADYGVSLSTLADIEEALAGIDLRKNELALYAGASNIALLAAIAAHARKSGVSLDKLTGAVAADPIGELASEGCLNRSLDEYYDEMAHSIAWAEKNAPKLKTVLIDADVYHSGGGNGIQEAAYAMGEAVAYIKAMYLRGIDADTFCKHVRLHFSVGANFFMEIAKLRGIKMLWSQLIDAFGGNKESKKIELFASTSAFTQTKYDPYVNLLRAASQSFSAVIGGVNGMYVRPFDCPIRPSDEFSRRIARNIQIMLQHEFNFLQPIDPAGGSWYLEPLTEEFAEKAWAKLQELEAAGGVVAALKTGAAQEDVKKVLEERFKNLATRKDRAVGNNMYPNMTEELLQAPPVDFAKLRIERASALAANERNRDSAKALEAVKKIYESDASEKGSLVEYAAKALLAGATMGEIGRALTGEGLAIAVKNIAAHRWTERFEELRMRTEKFKSEKKSNVNIFLANMGPIPQHKARADFVTSFMQVAAFDVNTNDGFPTAEEAVQAALASNADVAIVCSTDATYPELAPAAAKGIKAAKPQMKVFLAGAPSKELKQMCDAAGMDDYISVRSNCYETLLKMQKERGMF